MDFHDTARRKLRGFFKTDAACVFVVSVLAAFRALQLSLLGKHEDASKLVPTVVFDLTVSQFDNPFFQAHSGRVMPLFQAGVMAWLDAGRYLDQLDKEGGKDADRPRDAKQIKLIENAQAVSRVYREFVIAAAVADNGTADVVLRASKELRDALDELMETA